MGIHSLLSIPFDTHPGMKPGSSTLLEKFYLCIYLLSVLLFFFPSSSLPRPAPCSSSLPCPTSLLSSKGYTDVVRIPEGATHIKVRQFKAKDQTRFTAYLALKKKNGEYLINGKYMISTSETIIDINGTVMNYSGWSHRDDFLHGMGYSATKEILIVQILATDPTKALDVRYSFFVPKKSAPKANSVTSQGSNKVGSPTPQLQWVTGPWLACSRTCDTGWHTRTVQCQDGNRKLAKGCLLSQRPSAFKQCLLKKC